MLIEPIHITALSSISAIGTSGDLIFEAYQNPAHLFVQREFNGQKKWVAELPGELRAQIQELRDSDAKYKKLDDTVLYAIYTARKAIKQAGWSEDGQEDSHFGINIGSSRGATSLFEAYHQSFLEEGKSQTLASPTTTLGNISSWVAHDLLAKGPIISHSITCSTALHAILNAAAWLQSGMADKFLVGGSEAPLTPFTIAQMDALKIYSKEREAYPCKSLDFQKKKNTMVLGEGAAMACLEKGSPKNSLAKIVGMGYATEPLEHNVSISSDAICFQDSMKMAIGDFSLNEIDGIVMHAPGTVKGDVSEFDAIKKVFGSHTPFMTSNKWKLGHTFGASGMLSIEMAILMLRHQKPLVVPFIEYQQFPKKIDRVLVNAVGFGGNAVSILLERPN